MVKSDGWRTPKWFFDYCNHGFEVDAAADKDNALCSEYWDESIDGLKQSWEDRSVWCNPPWSNIFPWVEKALTSKAKWWLLLLPVRADTSWFHLILAYSRASEVNIIMHKGRLAFDDPFSKGRTAPREATMCVLPGQGQILSLDLKLAKSKQEEGENRTRIKLLD